MSVEADDSVRVLLVDDQALFREGLATLLGRCAGIEIVGEAEDGARALEEVERLGPHVVLMDLRMPVLDGVGATRAIGERFPKTRVLVLTTFDEDERVLAALQAGALGYLLKDSGSEEVARAIRLAARGESYLQPSVAARVVAAIQQGRPAASPPPSAEALEDPLTEREVQVLRALASGASNREIAATVFLAEGTVKNYVSSILSKLGVRDRTRAALRARELGLLDGSDRL